MNTPVRKNTRILHTYVRLYDRAAEHTTENWGVIYDQSKAGFVMAGGNSCHMVRLRNHSDRYKGIIHSVTNNTLQ